MKCSDEKCGGIINPLTKVCGVCGLIHIVQGDEVHKTAIPKMNKKMERAFCKGGIEIYKK